MDTKDLINDKKVLFITTKNIDYIRNIQEIRFIRKYADDIKIIGVADSGYFRRLVKVYCLLLLKQTKKYDIVFIGFAPQLVLPLFYKKFKSRPIVIDFFVSMYDTFVCDRQIIKNGSLVARILHWIDKKTLAFAQRIIADTKAEAEFFISEFKADSNKVEVLYLEADREIYYPRALAKMPYADKFVVLYFGSILPLQGVETVLNAARLLRDNEWIHFTVIGPVKSIINPYEGTNIDYIEWLSQNELAEKIAMADLCLAGHFNANSDKARRTIPGKAYIYEAMQKKMILGDNPANHEFFAQDNMHYYVEMGNAAELAEQIMRIAKEQNKG